MDTSRFPVSIKDLIGDRPYKEDSTGMSGSSILIFDDFVLKIEKDRKESEEEIALMRWLSGKLPVPKILCCEESDGYRYLLMTRIKGEMSCAPRYMEQGDELIRILAEGIKMLWSIDISDCPRVRDLDAELKEAAYRVENGLVNMEMMEPETFGEGGFSDPKDLLQWLSDHRPTFEPVFSHGDFCLPNIFIEEGKLSGFIDLGDSGVSDKWRDIALCYRSLKHNAEGVYNKERIYPGIDPNKLFEALGIAPDWDKIRYYILLDELF